MSMYDKRYMPYVCNAINEENKGYYLMRIKGYFDLILYFSIYSIGYGAATKCIVGIGKNRSDDSIYLRVSDIRNIGIVLINKNLPLFYYKNEGDYTDLYFFREGISILYKFLTPHETSVCSIVNSKVTKSEDLIAAEIIE